MKRNKNLRLLSLLIICCLLPALSAQALADDAFFCRKCGKAIPGDSNFCPYCGEAVIVLPITTEQPETAEEDKSVTDAIIAELIASIRTAASESSQTAPSAAAASVAEPEKTTTEPGPFQTVLSGNNLVYNEKVRVTKSPTSESVPYGGAAIFIARADYDTSITWYIANSDASVIYNVSDAPAHIQGLVVYGQGTETLTLCEIPSWMNGWQVQAGFTGKDGPVYSDVAHIWTYQLAEPVFYYDPPCNEVCWVSPPAPPCPPDWGPGPMPPPPPCP